MEAQASASEANMKMCTLQNQIELEKLKGEMKVTQTKLEHEKEQQQQHPPSWNPLWGPWGAHLGQWNPSWGNFPGSSLFNPHHFWLIQTWLGSPRSWSFRYRGSTHGFGSAQFHAQCDNIGPTVTIIKSTGGWIFGAYNPGSWNSTGNWVQHSGCFLFTLTNPNGTPPTAYYQKTTSNATYCNSGYGPTFGGGHDLYVDHNCNSNANSQTNFPNSYNDTTGRGNATFTGGRNYQVSEIEVFQV